MLLSLSLREQRRSVVAGEFRCARTARRGADIVLGDPHLDRLDTAVEVRTRWGGDDVEGVGVRRFHTEADLSRDHERAQVQRSLAASLRHPRLIDLDELAQGLKEVLVGKLRHSHALRGVLHAVCVLLRAEGSDGSVRLTVRLQALEDRLAVVEDHGRRLEFKRRVRLHAGIVPALVLGPVDRDHVVGEFLAKFRIFENIRTLLVARRILVFSHGEFQVRHASQAYAGCQQPQPVSGHGTGVGSAARIARTDCL